MAISSATSVKATGHEILPEITDFDIERWAFVLLSLYSSTSTRLRLSAARQVSTSKSNKKEREFRSKNYRPPHPIGVKGGCSPQNNLKKLRGY
jgi:hypothetical protein